MFNGGSLLSSKQDGRRGGCESDRRLIELELYGVVDGGVCGAQWETGLGHADQGLLVIYHPIYLSLNPTDIYLSSLSLNHTHTS